MGDLADSLNYPTQPVPGPNPFNPSGSTNNCAYMGFSHILWQSLDWVTDQVGAQPAAGSDGLSEQQLEAKCHQLGVTTSTSPPPPQVTEGPPKAAAAYKSGINPTTGATLYHIVAIEGGNSPRNYEYRDYQRVGNGEDATNAVRTAGGPVLYLWQPEPADIEAGHYADEHDEEEHPQHRLEPGTQGHVEHGAGEVDEDEPMNGYHQDYPMEGDEEEGHGEAVGDQEEEHGEGEGHQYDENDPMDGSYEPEA